MINPIFLLSATQPKVAEVSADALTPLYYLIGSMVVAQLIGAIFTFVKWLGSRTVEREDKDKEGIQRQLDDHDKKFEEIENSVVGRLEKQADFYRLQVKEAMQSVDKKIEDLEFRLRQDMARAVHDAMLISKSRNRS